MENKFTNLKKLEVQITANCNFACFYCGNNPFTREQKVITLDYELFKRCVDELMPEEVVITGGESTLVLNEVKDFFSYTKKRGIRNTLTSNLSILSKEELYCLADKYNVSKFNSSFNDFTETMSQTIRGASPQNRETICANMRYISEDLKLPLRVETLLIKETLPYISNINNLLYDLGVRHHALEFLNPNGYANWDMMLSTQSLVDSVMNAYREKKEDMLLEITCNYLSPCNEVTKPIYNINDEMFLVANCFDGKRVAYLTVDGDLIPCFMYSGLINNNNVKYNSPRKIWMNNDIFRKVKERIPSKCSTCNYYYNIDNIKTCSNGCWALLMLETGDIKEICCDYIERRMNSNG